VIEVVRPSTIAGPRILGLFIAINCLVVATDKYLVLYYFIQLLRHCDGWKA